MTLSFHPLDSSPSKTILGNALLLSILYKVFNERVPFSLFPAEQFVEVLFQLTHPFPNVLRLIDGCPEHLPLWELGQALHLGFLQGFMEIPEVTVSCPKTPLLLSLQVSV